MLRKICLLLCILLFGACTSGTPDTDRQAAIADEEAKQVKDYAAFLNSQKPSSEWLRSSEKEWENWEATSKTKRVSANLFASAARVRVYQGNSDLKISGKGNVTTHQYTPNAHDYPEVPAKSGGFLSSAEIKTLRKSVFYTLPPPAIAACCIPRHAFLFYDKAGKYLGYLEVCYECGCAQISPEAARDPKLDWIDWDAVALRKIIEAHRLTIKPRH